MMYLGDYNPGAIVRIPWNTHDAKGASVSRTAAGTVQIWKNSSVTQRTSSNGITDSANWDSRVGMHYLLLDLSDNSDAGFYAAGNDYAVGVITQTVAGQTLNTFLASFSIANRRAAGILASVAFPNFQFRMMTAQGVPVTGKVNANFTQKKYTIAGGASGNVSGTITEDPIGNGFYLVDLTAAELGGKSVSLVFSVAGALDTPITLILSQ